ncbi:MAG: hypothetical protein A3J63_04575 [Candidatus Moranbacteria bacterium RIFCSPHIGHO2_02_FULL_40_12b]|nr:MAG: hypothetical protein A3J63_04575 [Candidatus Moranbacteria bacterium RIFCSPHIGHO2_02_FULL_40_12b]
MEKLRFFPFFFWFLAVITIIADPPYRSIPLENITRNFSGNVNKITKKWLINAIFSDYEFSRLFNTRQLVHFPALFRPIDRIFTQFVSSSHGRG